MAEKNAYEILKIVYILYYVCILNSTRAVCIYSKCSLFATYFPQNIYWNEFCLGRIYADINKQYIRLRKYMHRYMLKCAGKKENRIIRKIQAKHNVH